MEDKVKKQTIIGTALPDMPWEEKPTDCDHVIWRYSQNPLIDRNPIPCAHGIYNSSVVPFEDGYAGIFRADYHSAMPFLHVGFSKDALDWEIHHEKIDFKRVDEGIEEIGWAYDPRVCKVDDDYIITWCNKFEGCPTIGIGTTKDFKTFHQQENAFLPYNRNGVMFPRKINGKYAMLSRPSDGGHTAFGDIYYSESPDLTHWGKHRHVMAADADYWWESTKIGAGPTPIETSEGWLLFYHGVVGTCNGFIYCMGVALLDLDEPWKVLARANRSMLTPEVEYEYSGRVPNVIFPCAALTDAPTGRIAIYYGSADTYTCVAFTQVDELLGFLKKNSRV